jgi:hypothetical protein
VKKLMSHTEEIIAAEIARSRSEPNVDPRRPTERVAISNQQALLSVDPRRILTGEVEVYDDRQRKSR